MNERLYITLYFNQEKVELSNDLRNEVRRRCRGAQRIFVYNTSDGKHDIMAFNVPQLMNEQAECGELRMDATTKKTVYTLPQEHQIRLLMNRNLIGDRDKRVKINVQPISVTDPEGNDLIIYRLDD